MAFTDEQQATINEREAQVRSAVKRMLAQPGFEHFCGPSAATNKPGGVLRVWVEQFWRVCRSRAGRCLLNESCWAEILNALNHTPMELYPHVYENLSTWRLVGSGSTAADKRFWDVEYVSGEARPRMSTLADLSRFEIAGLEKSEEDFAMWLLWTGGKPHHHNHPVPLEAAFGAESFEVRRTVSKAAGLTITGGAPRYSVTLSNAPSWVSVSATSLQMSPGAEVDTGEYSATITVTDATSQTVVIVLPITVTTSNT